MSRRGNLTSMGPRARAAAAFLRDAPAESRSAAIRAMAARLRAHEGAVLAANAEDVAKATMTVDRLRLDEGRLEDIAVAMEQIAGLPDPVGVEIDRWRRPNGLDIARVRTPIGVIAMVYESRPNVTADAAAIAIRSGNAIILRSGSDAHRSAMAIHRALAEGLEEAGIVPEAVQIVPTTDRAAVGELLGGLGGAIDLVIPRGGKSLVARVEAEARVPVLGHLEGICHTYVHADADPAMATAIVSTRRCAGSPSAGRRRRC